MKLKPVVTVVVAFPTISQSGLLCNRGEMEGGGHGKSPSSLFDFDLHEWGWHACATSSQAKAAKVVYLSQ